MLWREYASARSCCARRRLAKPLAPSLLAYLRTWLRPCCAQLLKAEQLQSMLRKPWWPGSIWGHSNSSCRR